MSRFTVPLTVYLLLLKDNEVLLMRRQNTGWGDGDYDMVAGHIDGGEFMTSTLLREAKEEIGITIKLQDAEFVNLAHCLIGNEYVYATFAVKKWQNEPTIMEPEKCDDLQWFPLSALPSRMTPGTRAVLEAYRVGERYTEIAD